MRDELRPVRSFLAMLRRPQLRHAVGGLLAESPGAADAPELAALEQIGAAERDGVGLRLREGFLEEAVAALDARLGPLAVLDGERVALGDLGPSQVDDAVARVVERVVAPAETLDERALGDRLGLFVADVAFFRRHACDLGLLEREADGSAYRRPKGALRP
ncbi:hypothetical protein USB125703_01265 [Pseudoclavibacter triregionum]|nr:hypothetical protein USB125703_01265 [Pseudoclavibacter triregionum]